MSTSDTHDDLRQLCSQMVNQCELILRRHGNSIDNITAVNDVQDTLRQAEQAQHIEGTERHFKNAWRQFETAFDEQTRKTTLDPLLSRFEESGTDLAEISDD